MFHYLPKSERDLEEKKKRSTSKCLRSQEKKQGDRVPHKKKTKSNPDTKKTFSSRTWCRGRLLPGLRRKKSDRGAPVPRLTVSFYSRKLNSKGESFPLKDTKGLANRISVPFAFLKKKKSKPAYRLGKDERNLGRGSHKRPRQFQSEDRENCGGGDLESSTTEGRG